MFGDPKLSRDLLLRDAVNAPHYEYIATPGWQCLDNFQYQCQFLSSADTPLRARVAILDSQ